MTELVTVVAGIVVVVVVVVLIVDDGTCEVDDEDRFPTKFFRNCSILCQRLEDAPVVGGVELSFDDVFIISMLLSSGTFSSLSILNNEDAIIVLISARLLCSLVNWVSD